MKGHRIRKRSSETETLLHVGHLIHVDANDTSVCYGLTMNPACSTIVIATRMPLAERYVGEQWVFDTLRSLGFFNSTDTTRSANSLGFQLISTLLQNNLQFNDSIVQESRQLLQEARSDYRVGIHIRLSNGASDFREYANFIFPSDIPRFANCTFIDFAKHPAFFVASDSSYAKQVISRSVNATVITQARKAVHSKGEILSGKASIGVYSALVDIITLSQCSIIIGTRGSSLTYVAAALSGAFPYYVDKNTDCYDPKEVTTIRSYFSLLYTVIGMSFLFQ